MSLADSGSLILDLRTVGTNKERWMFFDRKARVAFSAYGQGDQGYIFTGGIDDGFIRQEFVKDTDSTAAIPCYATLKGESFGNPTARSEMVRILCNAFMSGGQGQMMLRCENEAGTISEQMVASLGSTVTTQSFGFSDTIRGGIEGRYFLTPAASSGKLVIEGLNKLYLEGKER